MQTFPEILATSGQLTSNPSSQRKDQEVYIQGAAISILVQYPEYPPGEDSSTSREVLQESTIDSPMRRSRAPSGIVSILLADARHNEGPDLTMHLVISRYLTITVNKQTAMYYS